MLTAVFRPCPLAISLIAASGLVSSLLAHAQDTPQRLGLCASCHGGHGIASAPSIPNLAGQNLEYLRSAMQQYRSGARDVAAMRAAAGMLPEPEIDTILRWYAQQNPQDRGAQ
jgi:cytochrome c553